MGSAQARPTTSVAVSLLWLVIAFFLGAPYALGQTCVQKCAQMCGPIQDVGKEGYLACMRVCESRCSNPPKPPKCPSSSGTLLPKYYVLGLIYAPPGCTSTSSQKCAAVSSVDYKDGSTMGTKVSTESSFAFGVNASVNATGINVGIFKLGAGVSGGYSTTSTDSSSQTVTKGQGLELKVNGNDNGVDHTQDEFILLLNPAVAVQESQAVVNGACSAAVDANWLLGVSTAEGGSQVLYTLTVGELENPSSMPAAVASQLKALNFTTNDYQAILGLDPFATGPGNVNTPRFVPTTYSFPYEPLIQQTDCSNGVCSCLIMSESISNDFQTAIQNTSQAQYKVGVSESAGLNLGIFSLGASSDQNWTWTSSSTQGDTTDQSQNATATITCPSTAYQGPTIMGIYWDTLFGSFLFSPITLGSQTTVMQQGILRDAAGNPKRHVPVDLAIAGKAFHTFTNNNGEYVFFKPTTQIPDFPNIGQLLINGRPSQTVSLGSAQKLSVQVP